MGKPLRVLMIEDSEDDVLLVLRALEKGGYAPVHERVETAEAMRRALGEKPWDVILCDYRLPQFNGLAAIALLKSGGVDIPLIIVSGAIGEETAADCMRYGAHDYVMKGSLSRLVPAIKRELQEAESRRKRKQAEAELRSSEDRYRSLFDNSIDAVLLTDPEGGILAANPEACRIFGRTEEEICRIGRKGLMDPNDPRLAEALEVRERTGQFRGELTFVRKDGTSFPGEISSVVFKDREGNARTSMIIRDITDRRRADEAIVKSEERFRKAFYISPDAVNINRLEDGMYVSINPGFSRITGYQEEEIIGKTSLELNIWNNLEDRRRLLEGLKKDGAVTNLEAAFRMKNGEVRHGLMSASVIDLDGVPHILNITRDITERRLAAEALKESEERYRQLLEVSPIGIGVHSDGKMVFINPAGARILGARTPEEVIGMPIREIVHPDSWSASRDRSPRMLAGEQGLYPIEDRYLRLDGTEVPVQVIAVPLTFKGSTSVQVIVQDITERKLAEQALKDSEHKYRLLVENAEEAILIAQDGMLKYVNPATSRILGYSEEELVSRSFIEIIHPEDRESLLQAHIRRMQSKDTMPVQQFRAVCKDGSVKWADSNAVVVSWEGKPATLNFLTDITARKKAEEAVAGSVSRLRTALVATVQAIAVTVETRDPYTAGHQRKVADLSRAIATEMGLSADQVDGIAMAGIIHDLGKIAVPAEILSKPTRLTDLEFSLIKTHARAGYDILRDIEFPWPIARMILEHHERMDGSGYPNRLTGDQLLVESRILSVADVVEAIASHRPYRPALGIGFALDEITKNRGVLYDPVVVDACLRLFQAKQYRIAD